jgi:hypothetical protein
MVKVFLLLRRAPHLTREQFLAYWREQHSELVLRTAAAMGIRRYTQNYPLHHPMGETMRTGRGALAADYDGIVEACWDSFEALAEIGDSTGDIAAQLFADEQRFLDLPRCEMWIASEKTFISQPACSILSNNSYQ